MEAGPLPSPPQQEKEIGMEVFFTRTPGVGGRIKVYPEDFVVEEISRLPPPGDGKYVIARIESRGWETNALLKKFSAALNIPVGAIGFAGMKDKRAITRQVMSFPCSIEDVLKVKLRGVKIDVMYRSYMPIFRGNLDGNRFDVIIRDVREDAEAVSRTAEEIGITGGFPNFFGVQRFGVIRPITHMVGKHILLGDMERAVMTYIANPIEGEEKEAYNARKFMEKNMDFGEALKVYPKKLVFERQMIEHLAKRKGDWAGALKKLPKNLSVMFVHAYQSYIFNKILSMRLKKGLPINEAVEGDIVITFENRDVQSRRGMTVKKSNIEKINKQIRKGNCFPSAIIIGYDSSFAEGEMGEIERKVVEEEGITSENFLVHEIPFLSSKGMRRIILSPPKRINWSMGEKTLNLSFSLPRGCYATSLLREFMKADIKNY